jgi:ATP-binding cassette subfamily B (MDR/TAP) protein 1
MRKSGLVGESGCGKSTILQLVMRFYDPDEGRITLDGHDLRTLELKWLRENIGYVGQEPVLFAASIRENLLFGKEDASEAELIGALRRAEAYDFVFDLEDKMETFVGMGGGQLSGGQRQRIAIARTLLKNPQILLFDEATSALDRRNERLIQKTLDQISAGHTSITVAHRVRTIMNSDVIHVLDKGKVIESG